MPSDSAPTPVPPPPPASLPTDESTPAAPVNLGNPKQHIQPRRVMGTELDPKLSIEPRLVNNNDHSEGKSDGQ